MPLVNHLDRLKMQRNAVKPANINNKQGFVSALINFSAKLAFIRTIILNRGVRLANLITKSNKKGREFQYTNY